jgi:hypothetical protein
MLNPNWLFPPVSLINDVRRGRDANHGLDYRLGYQEASTRSVRGGYTKNKRQH